MAVSADLVKVLRNKTGAPIMDCKRALQESDGDMDGAVDVLKQRGVAVAEKKASRGTSAGAVAAYIHAGGRVGVLLELGCETDFVARNEEFVGLAREIAIQVAALNPTYVSREQVPEAQVEEARAAYAEDVLGEPPEIARQILDVKLNKFFFSEKCLLDQVHVRDEDGKQTISALIQEKIAKFGENIVVRRFVRYALGE